MGIDFHLPGMDGIEAARLLANRAVRLEVVITSGDDSPKVRAAVAAIGVRFVPKHNFAAEIGEMIERRFGVGPADR